MKKLFALLLCLCEPSWATIALVNNVSGSGANTFTSSGVDTSGSNLLVVVVSGNAAAGTLSDSNSNTWSPLTAHSDGANQVQISYAKNATVGTGHTFTMTGSSIFTSICVLAFSGADTTAPFDQENGTQGGGFDNTNFLPGSITPGSNNEVVVSGVSFNNTQTMSVNSGLAITDQVNFTGGTNYGCAGAYIVQGTAAAINPQWTMTAPTTAGGITQASFKAGAAVATTPVCPSPFCGIIGGM